mmetsp:Transcript_35132/g.74937  ORF Transcript_35132/g.74937 Transcript_35132/m.74937 type:complete len:341 (+) Transcript_35132:609-1631(+)
MEDVLDRLRERPGVEKAVHGVHLRVLPRELLLLLLDLAFVVHLLGDLGLVLVGPLHRLLALLPRAFVQRLANDLDVLFDGAQFVPVLLLLLPGLVHVLGLVLLLIALLLLLRLPLASFRLLTFFGGVFSVEGSVEEGNVTRNSVETHSDLEAEPLPVKMGGGALAYGALPYEGLGQPDGVVAGDLDNLLRLPRGLIRNQVDILRIQHRLAGVTHVLPQGVVPIAEAVQLVAVVAFAAAGGVGVSGAHGNLALEIALPTAQDATVPLGLPRDAHDLELLLLRLPSVPAAGRPAVLLVVRVVFVFLLFGRAILAVLVLDVFLVVILGGVASLLRHGGMHCLD